MRNLSHATRTGHVFHGKERHFRIRILQSQVAVFNNGLTAITTKTNS